MTTLADFTKTDNVHDVLAIYYNILLGSILRSEFKNVETLSADVNLTDGDTPIQVYDPDGSNYDVVLPIVDAIENHMYMIRNAGISGTLVVKSNDEATIHVVLSPGEAVLLLPDGAGEYIAIHNTSSTSSVVPGGRLTLTSGLPVTTSDVTGATNIYYAPFMHNKIELWTGSYWKSINFSEVTLALGTLTSGLPYDVFAYLSSGSLALEILAWTNGTTRETGISYQDGQLCKTGDKTRLYLGTFYTTSTTATEDSAAKRLLWNAYNRVTRKLKTGNSGGFSMGFGLGVDSTTVNSADIYTAAGSSGAIVFGQARYNNVPSVGYHYYQALERGGNGGTTTFYGDSGVDYLQAGITGSCMA